MIGEPVIDFKVDPTGGELVAAGIKIRLEPSFGDYFKRWFERQEEL